MIVKALYLLFLLTFLVLPFFYHRKKSRPSMTKFYLRMAFSHNFRKCYRLVLLSALLMFHFITSPCSSCRWNWPLVRGMPVAVLPSDFRACTPLFAERTDTSRRGSVLHCLPI